MRLLRPLLLSLVLAPAATAQQADTVAGSAAPDTVRATTTPLLLPQTDPVAPERPATPPSVVETPPAAEAQPAARPPATEAPAAEPNATAAQTDEAAAPPDTTLETLRDELAALGAVTDSLARGVTANRARADSIAARTNAADVAQQTVERVGEEATRAIQNFVPKLILALILLLASVYVLRGLVWLLESFADRSAERRLFYKRLIPVTRLLVWTLAAYLIVAGIFQIPGTSLLAAGAAIGVAIGFAAQDVLKNIFGGLIIILDQPFQVGDKISVEGTYGEVVSIGLRSTRITTPDDNLVTVPNSQIVDGQVANANAGALDCQVVTDLWLPGWVDVALAKRLAYEAAVSSKYVYLNKPVVVIAKDEFKETFLLHLKVKAYVLDARFEFL
ncbi:MAG: mechanosensitive ion channel, partial [Rhodothermales bacterium]|nr:mechanosensitive ion channel [Rhodothermales bacterium]